MFCPDFRGRRISPRRSTWHRLPSYGCDPLPGPYIDGDPRLDPLVLPQPGWVWDVEVATVLPHVMSGIAGPVTVGHLPTNTLALPVAPFDWTAAPRLEIGHRLPEGLGEFAIAYRFLGSTGTGTTVQRTQIPR